MNYLSPKYGKKILSKFPLDPIIRDYGKMPHINHDTYSRMGITVLGYSSYYRDINVRIKYLPSNEVVFEIEMFEGKILNSTWDNEDVDEDTYEYFSFIIQKIITDIDETRNHLNKFKSKYWVERNKKLSKIIDTGEFL